MFLSSSGGSPSRTIEESTDGEMDDMESKEEKRDSLCPGVVAASTWRLQVSAAGDMLEHGNPRVEGIHDSKPRVDAQNFLFDPPNLQREVTARWRCPDVIPGRQSLRLVVRNKYKSFWRKRQADQRNREDLELQEVSDCHFVDISELLEGFLYFRLAGSSNEGHIALRNSFQELMQGDTPRFVIVNAFKYLAWGEYIRRLFVLISL
eukprot:767051-Hanusia_phi.AAC.8